MAKKKRSESEERSFLAIDLDRLDEEWVEQPDLYKQWSDELADAKRDLATEEATLDVVRSEVARDIRRDPGIYGFDKLTEPIVKELIPLQKKFKRQQAVVIDTKHAVDVLVGAVKALEHRKKALENEVFLFGQGYFSSPRAKGGESAEKMREAEKRSARSRVKKLTREDMEDDDDD